MDDYLTRHTYASIVAAAEREQVEADAELCLRVREYAANAPMIRPRLTLSELMGDLKPSDSRIVGGSTRITMMSDGNPRIGFKGDALLGDESCK